MMKIIWTTAASNQTESIGQVIGRQLKSGDVVILSSDLGGGKTTLTRGIAKGAGSVDEVSSPTFSLCNEYKLKDGDILSHYDFYRLNDPGIMKLQLQEALQNKGIVIIEWPHTILDVIPDNSIHINIGSVESDQSTRTFELNSNQEDFIADIKEPLSDFIN